MKAFEYNNYGGPEELQLNEVDKSIPKDDEVLIKVKAVGLNASDLEMLTANPAYVRMWGLFKPKHKILGSDISGTIVEKGNQVSDFNIGDDVYGDFMYRWGGLAEYICLPAKLVSTKPAVLSHAQAAAIPQAATVAYQSLIYKNEKLENQEVLIIGGGGGTGSFAIQIAKSLGAKVTAVDRQDKLEFMQSLGADEVVNYQVQDPTKLEKQFDKIIAVVSPNSIASYSSILKPDGIFIMAGGTISKIFQCLITGGLISLFTKKKIAVLGHQQSIEDLKLIENLIVTGKIKPAVDKTFPFAKTKEAFKYFLDKNAKGKVVIEM